VKKLVIGVMVAGIVLVGGPRDRAQAGVGNTVYLPNIVRMLGGPDGWQTPFIVQNTGSVATDLEVTFYAFADGSCVTRRIVPALASERPR